MIQRQKKFPFSISPLMRSLIQTDAAQDPIGRQFIPSSEEELASPALPDPIGDQRFMPTPGLVHRYPDRVLWKVSTACAVYCRFCFRNQMLDNEETALNEQNMAAALHYIRSHEELFEVILSGGDPLVLHFKQLEKIFRALDAISHLSLIRIHSRLPVVRPEALGEDKLRLLREGRLPRFLVLHINHPRELSPPTLALLQRLSAVGIPLLSQSVLLRGVNDDVQVLSDLMHALLKAKIKPYYLHHLDAAPGTAHFRVSLDEGLRLYQQLRKRVSGLAVPHYIVEIPGGGGKVPVEILNETQREELARFGIV